MKQWDSLRKFNMLSHVLQSVNMITQATPTCFFTTFVIF